jgi:hypothetical protein
MKEFVQLPLGRRVRAAVVAASASLLLVGTTLPGAAMAEHSSTTQTTASAHTPEALGAHTHQLHGEVKTAGSSGSNTFALTTERYGDVTVSFSGGEAKHEGRGHGHGADKARSFAVTNAADVKAGQRVVVHGSTSTDGNSFVARRVRVLPDQEGDHADNSANKEGDKKNHPNGQ